MASFKRVILRYNREVIVPVDQVERAKKSLRQQLFLELEVPAAFERESIQIEDSSEPPAVPRPA